MDWRPESHESVFSCKLLPFPHLHGKTSAPFGNKPHDVSVKQTSFRAGPCVSTKKPSKKHVV